MGKGGGWWGRLFRGVSILHLDAKGRLAIPARYRERLESEAAGRLVITLDRDRCLLLYPEPEWASIEERFAALPAFDPAARALQRLYIGNAQEVELDTQGRILIPPQLRAFAGLDKRVAFVGQGVKFEIWDEAAWQRQMEAALSDLTVSELARSAGISGLTL